MIKVLKWIGIGLGGLVGLAVVVAVVLVLVGSGTFNRKYDVQVESITVPTDAASIERGEHIVHAISLCIDCHGENLEGGVLLDDPMLGTLVASNLTSGKGGVAGTYTDADWVRLLRYGVRPDGTSVNIMPAQFYSAYSDADLGAVIAYFKSLPPVDNNLPERRWGLMGRFGVGTGMFPKPVAAQIQDMQRKPMQVAPALSSEYGEYLSYIGSCRDCHGMNLSGNAAVPDLPQGPNLTPGGDLAGWDEAGFVATFRTGKIPSGRLLNDEMPWKKYREMSDLELQALWLYLSGLEPRADNQ